MANFYKKDGSYFNATDNSKILNPTDLQALAKAGGKEISAPKIEPAPVSNKMDSSTLNLGIQSPNINLPSSNDQAVSLYTDRNISDGTKQQAALQAELDTLKANRIKDNQTQLANEQAKNNNLVADKNAQINKYDNQFNPLKDKAVGIYDSMLNSIKGTNYSDLVKEKLNLTNDIVNYSKMMQDELNSTPSSGLASITANRSNAIKENYTSKIAVAQAAQSAIDGNFNLAFDIMDKGANAIEKLTTDRINFINTVKGIFDTPISDSNTKITNLTTEEKRLLDNAVNDAQTKLDNLQANKNTIMDLMKTNPLIANKAGLSLTDTPEQTAQKLSDFYQANPQYTPDNQAFIKGAMEKYYDAGITLNDPIETVKSKILNSNSYKNEQSTNQIKLQQSGLVYDNNGNLVKDVSGSTADQIANAIKLVESGGNYNAQGASGENGAYQFMPGTWASWSSEYASQVLQQSVAKLPMTPENQDAVAKFKIQQWLNQGYTPDQIASMWNSGSPDYQGKVGVNSKGVKYDVPSYVNKVTSVLAKTASSNNNAGGTTGSSQIDTSIPGYATALVPNGGGLTQAAIDKAAIQYATTGVMPSVGLGSTGAAAQKRDAIQARAAELDANGSISANKSKLQALTKSLGEQTTYLNTIERSINTVDDNLKILEDVSTKVNKSDSPMINELTNMVKSKYIGSGELAAFKSALQTVRTEYSFILARGGQVTEGTRIEAANLIPENISKNQLDQVLQVLRTEGTNVKGNAQAQVDDVSNQINNIIGGGNLFKDNKNDPLNLGNDPLGLGI